MLILSDSITVKDNKTIFFELTNSAFADSFSTYSHNEAESLFKMRTHADLILDNVTFEYNISTEGLLDIMLSRLLILQSAFRHNFSRKSSGCLFCYKIDNATISETTFFNNTAT